MQKYSQPLPLYLRILSRLSCHVNGVSEWYRTLPQTLPITTQNLERPLRPNQRRLVIGNKIVILTVKT